jgi:hypothetical protein
LQRNKNKKLGTQNGVFLLAMKAKGTNKAHTHTKKKTPPQTNKKQEKL